jgi:transcription-repair coupling factor (superfamily II helicase)
LLDKLVRLGYSHVPLVEDRGAFSIRGGILDIFPPDLPAPVRIEFFGDFVETIRTFDPATQRSLLPLDELILLPSREVIISDKVVKDFAPRLKRRCDELEITADRRRDLLEQLNHAMYPPGIEYLQPLFHPGLETIFDYAGIEAIRVIIDPLAVAAAQESFAGDLAVAGQRALERDAITCAASDLFLSADTLAGLVASGRRLEIPALELADEEPGSSVIRLHSEENRELKLEVSIDGEGVLKPLAERLLTWLADNNRILVACHQLGQAKRLYELLAH